MKGKWRDTVEGNKSVSSLAAPQVRCRFLNQTAAGIISFVNIIRKAGTV